MKRRAGRRKRTCFTFVVLSAWLVATLGVWWVFSLMNVVINDGDCTDTPLFPLLSSPLSSPHFSLRREGPKPITAGETEPRSEGRSLPFPRQGVHIYETGLRPGLQRRSGRATLV